MAPIEKTPSRDNLNLNRFALFGTIFWTVVLFALFDWQVAGEKTRTADLALFQSRAFFQSILTTRYWNASHGGVYVPVTTDTQPNPFLEDSLRDLVTTDGLVLTKINPAFMTRQIGEIARQRDSVWFHITSLNPIRPANKADDWEQHALGIFSSEFPDFYEFTKDEDETPLFRYMAPLYVEKPCLGCHAKQGYKLGDQRGGISVTAKVGALIEAQADHIVKVAGIYAFIWLLGLLSGWPYIV